MKNKKGKREDADDKPTSAHCGGIYARAEAWPKYHHIDEGSPPRVNAVRPLRQWQTIDIIFHSPKFDQHGRKAATRKHQGRN